MDIILSFIHFYSLNFVYKRAEKSSEIYVYKYQNYNLIFLFNKVVKSRTDASDCTFVEAFVCCSLRENLCGFKCLNVFDLSHFIIL